MITEQAPLNIVSYNTLCYVVLYRYVWVYLGMYWYTQVFMGQNRFVWIHMNVYIDI